MLIIMFSRCENTPCPAWDAVNSLSNRQNNITSTLDS